MAQSRLNLRDLVVQFGEEILGHDILSFWDDLPSEDRWLEVFENALPLEDVLSRVYEGASSSTEGRQRISRMRDSASVLRSAFAGNTLLAHFRNTHGQTWMHVAARECHSFAIEALMQSGCICDLPSAGNGEIPIHASIQESIFTKLNFISMMSSSTNVNVRYCPRAYNSSQTLVMSALDTIFNPLTPRILRYLIEKGVAINQYTNDGYTELALACCMQVNRTVDRCELYPMEWWEAGSQQRNDARQAWLDCVRILRENGANVDVWIPSHHCDMKERIYECGNQKLCHVVCADKSLENAICKPAPLIAIDINEPNRPAPRQIIDDPDRFRIGQIVATVDGILDQQLGDDYTLHHPTGTSARIADAIKEIDLAIEEGWDLHERNDELETALHWAADRGPCEVVRHLLHRGAWPDLGDRNGNTALHRCIMGANYFALLALVNCEHPDPDYRPPRPKAPRFHWWQANNDGLSPLALLARSSPPAQLWPMLYRRLIPFQEPQLDWQAACYLCLRKIDEVHLPGITAKERAELEHARCSIVEELMLDPGTDPTRIAIPSCGVRLLDFVRAKGDRELCAALGIAC